MAKKRTPGKAKGQPRAAKLLRGKGGAKRDVKGSAKGGAKGDVKGSAKDNARGGAKNGATSSAKAHAKSAAPKAAAPRAHSASRATGAARASGPTRAAAGAARSAGTTRTPRPAPAASPAPAVTRASVGAAAAKATPATVPANVPALARGRYVYCIIRSSAPLTFGPIGIGGDPTEVYTVNWRDLAAVMSDSPPGVQDPTRENVLAHQRVNETVMQEHTVLPMSFGTVFKTKDDIVEFLRSAYDAFADVLNKMENKLEFGLKVLWDRDAVLQAIEQDDEDIRRLKGEIASQKGSTYFARMQYGRLVDAALQARSERYVVEIFAALRDVAVAARSNKPIGDRMIMNAAFLVSRAEEPAFDARVKELGATYDKLTFKYTGPWPPYNFVNIRLKLERA
jgi:hypothetical protein